MSEEASSKSPEEERVAEVADHVVEEQAAVPDADEKHAEKKGAADPLKDALRQFERQVGVFGQALGEALQGRGNVVMVRVNDEALKHLDMLVDAEMTKSRSESAAFLISAGIQANQAMFDKISAITQQIAELREQLRKEVKMSSDRDEEAAAE